MTNTKGKTLSIDLETYSSVDLSKAGVYRYAESPDFEILLLSYAFDDRKVYTLDLTRAPLQKTIAEALVDPETTKRAWNANFERVCLARYLGKPMPPQQWQDTMITSAELGLPMSLAAAGKVLGLSEEKLKMQEGKNLIQYFSKPCRPTKTNGGRTRNLPEHDPEKWAKYKEYNARDVETEREISKLLDRYEIEAREHKLWCIDQDINDRGVMIDRKLAENAARLDEQIKEALKEEARQISGLDNPNSPVQIKRWIKERTGVEVESLDKRVIGEVRDQLKGFPGVSRFLQIRSQLAITSTAKYSRMLQCTNEDDRARGLSQFYGASRTGRWSGRNIQLQNLKQNKMPDQDLDIAREIVRSAEAPMLGLLYEPGSALSELIRTAFIPRPGYKFVVSDFSAIEARVLAWLAGEEWRLEAFDRGEDIYCSSASSMFGVPVEKHGVNGHLRQKGKVAELACIAENSLVLTDKGLVPIQEVTTEHLLWDGKEWVGHEGVIDKGIKEVFDYDGLTATGDHLVYIEGQAAPIRFRVAASSGARLAQTGDGGRALWFCGDNQLGEEMEQGVESLLRSDQMHEMRSHKMAAVRQSEIRTSKGLPGLFQSATDPAVARQEADRCKTTVRESERPELQELRRTRNRIQVRLGQRGRALSDQQVRRTGQVAGARQDRQRRTLRAGEPALRNTRKEQGEPTANRPESLRSKLLALRALSRNAKIVRRDEPRGDHRGRAQSGTGAKEKLANHTKTARVYDIRNAGRRHRFTVSGRLVHNCGYGGSVGALKAMGALDMGLQENELKPLVDSWRAANRNITNLWWAVDKAAKACVKYGDRQAIKGGGWNVKSRWNVYKIDGTHEGETFAVSEDQAINNVRFREDLLYSDMADFYAEEIREGPRLAVRMDNMLMRILLPSGREISYAKPKIEGDDLTYEGQIQAGGWGRIETYGPKLVENIIQATSRDCLAESMRRLETAGIPIVFHVHDEVICEVPQDGPSAEDIAQIMGKPIMWAPGLPMKADAYECQYYRKD